MGPERNNRLPGPGDPDLGDKPLQELLADIEATSDSKTISSVDKELHLRLLVDPESREIKDALNQVVWHQAYLDAINEGMTPADASEAASFKVWDYAHYSSDDPKMRKEEEARIALFTKPKE